MKRHEPIPEIKFAAKSGFLSRDLWNEFFAHGCVSWQYKLWDSLTEKKIFLPHHSPIASTFLILNKRHPLVEKTVGEKVVSSPLVAHLDRFETVATTVLRLLTLGLITGYQTESELKRLSPKIVRYYDTGQKEMFPDALIQLANEGGTRIAIEMELTKKTLRQYRPLIDAYSDFRLADMVVFIVRTERISRTIKQAMRDSCYPESERPVGFGRIEDWLANPSLAKISFKEEVTSLLEIANRPEKNAG
jgi:hypothetical protein